MTRLALLADIHGNLPALEAVLDDLARFPVEEVIVAGDVVNWGPFSAQVVERIAHEGWTVVRGNNELYLLDYNTPRAPAEWKDRSQYPLIPWLHRQLNGRLQSVIAGWPERIDRTWPDAPPLCIFHGSPQSPWDSLFPNTPEKELETMLKGTPHSTLIAGHTHVAMERRIGRWHIFNPGSVGVPLDGKFSASYLLLEGNAEGWHARFRRVPFDYAAIFREFERQRFVDECGLVGQIVLEEFRTARLQLYPLLKWRAACCPGAPFTRALLDEFAKADRREYLPAAYRAFED